MHGVTTGCLGAIAALFLAGGTARAQSAATCSFDAASAVLSVQVDETPAELRAVTSTGRIRLDGVPCGEATVNNTDTILVSGGPGPDDLFLVGRFEPGLTPEPSGASEIEISIDLGAHHDEVILELSGGNDLLTFTSDGIDIRNDLDRDIAIPAVEEVVVNAGDGDDRIDASAYASTALFGEVHLHGGNGRDILTGSLNKYSSLYGEGDDDTLRGGNESDALYGGLGNDVMIGRAGDDYFFAEATADGADDMRGGDGNDEVSYQDRQNAVTVTIGDSQPDGENGEGDLVRGDIEDVIGGDGPDVLVGNEVRNVLHGFDGDDELYGGGGDDFLHGSDGNDLLVGDDGNDFMSGGSGIDSLVGGFGADTLNGHGGGDVLQGGPGADLLDGGFHTDQLFGDGGSDTFINDDGHAESVDCGPGAADDAEPDPLDTFIGCEL